MHEELQVNTALISRHGHHWVSLALVTFIKQLWDEPNMKARFIYLRTQSPSVPHLPSVSRRLSLEQRLPRGHSGPLPPHPRSEATGCCALFLPLTELSIIFLYAQLEML